MASLDIWFGGCLFGLSRVQLLNRAHVTRGKMSASFAGLRYVLLPPGKAPPVKAPASAGGDRCSRSVSKE